MSKSSASAQESIAEPGFELRLDELRRVLRQRWLTVFGVSFGAGVATLLVMLAVPNYYRARATITPTGDEAKAGSALGALASFGVSLGGPSKVEDLEILLKSSDLAVRVFNKHDIWADVFGPSYDPATKLLRPSLLGRLTGVVGSAPGDWEAIRATEENLRILVVKKAGTLTISFDTNSKESSSRVVSYFLDEAKGRLQDEAMTRAQRNRRFLEEQLATTSDALARDRLFSLLGQELEKDMMAKNREQYGFKVLDSPRVPDRKAGPRRALVSAAAAVAAGIFSALWLLSRQARKTLSNAPPS